MRALLILLLFLSLQGCSKEIKQMPTTPPPTKIESFKQVWKTLISDPYKSLPHAKVTLGSLYTFSKNLILADAKRTLRQRDDLLPPFDKLVHPNGICFRGVWEITRANPYSGYFQKGSRSLIIARASSAMSETRRGGSRSFGMAGKLFGTMREGYVSNSPTANFFVIDDLGGTDAWHYGDVALTNEPKVSKTFAVFSNILTVLKITQAFTNADSHSTIRQLYEISELGSRDTRHTITPKWMRIQPHMPTPRDEKDFREELRIGEGEVLVFDIAVASQKRAGRPVWQTIGTITFDASITSKSCDHQLHFHHPLWREGLRYE